MTLENLDRTLFELIRKEVVRRGYLPDWSLITGATLESRQKAYQIAKNELSSAMNRQLIDVFTVTSGEFKDAKSKYRIAIERKQETQGTQFSFDAPYKTSNIEYDVRVISETVEYERLMQNIVKSCFQIGYIAPYDSNTKTFESNRIIQMNSNGIIPINATTNLEILMRYTCIDVWIHYDSVECVKTPLLSTVEFEITPFGN